MSNTFLAALSYKVCRATVTCGPRLLSPLGSMNLRRRFSPAKSRSSEGDRRTCKVQAA